MRDLGLVSSPDDILKELEAKTTAARDFVQETGLCYKCKVNLVVLGQVRCRSCITQLEEKLTRLRAGGLVEVRVASKGNRD